MTEFLRRGSPGMKVRVGAGLGSKGRSLAATLDCRAGGRIAELPTLSRHVPALLTHELLRLLLQSVKDMPILQDGPPPGGFPAIRYARRVPSTGPTGLTLFAVGSVVVAYGFYKVGQTNKGRRADKEEHFAARKALSPFLQAEEDRRCVAAGWWQRLVERHGWHAAWLLLLARAWRLGAMQRGDCGQQQQQGLAGAAFSADHPPVCCPLACRWVKAHKEFVTKQAGVMKHDPDFKAEESVYKTRWMPPAKAVGVWGSA